MSAPYQGQSTAKTVFLLASAAGWLIVGASLIYLVPIAINTFMPSDVTNVWMDTLARGGYKPQLALYGGGVAFVLTVAINALWYQSLAEKFDSK